MRQIMHFGNRVKYSGCVRIVRDVRNMEPHTIRSIILSKLAIPASVSIRNSQCAIEATVSKV